MNDQSRLVVQNPFRFASLSRTMIGAPMVKAVISGFVDLPGSDSRKSEMYLDVVSSLIAFLLAVVIISFVGKWLWNNVVVDLFTIAKPARNIWQILGLMVFVSLLLK
jgi:hypothetical protein